MRARVPASTANLGPGFDTLAIALELYVEVSVEAADKFTLTSAGEGADLPCDKTHLAARVAIDVARTDKLAIHVQSAIPLARGLGSSAALAVAAAAAAGAEDPLAVAAAIEPSADNVSASVLGGLVAVAKLHEGLTAIQLDLDPGLVFVVLVPERQLSTSHARAQLPNTVPYADAVFDLSRVPHLIAGLADRRLLRGEATADVLHQPYRATAFPEAPRLLDGLIEAGALASCWSGAGPSLLGICDETAGETVFKAGNELLARFGVPGRAMLLNADRQGVVLETGS